MAALTGKVAIVTGAASGVGKETALRFSREGAAVVATDLNGDGLAPVVERIRADGGKALPFTMDVADREQILSCFAATIAEFGQLDVLVNNAGMSSANAGSPDNDMWDQGIATTFSSVYWMSKEAVRHMKGRGGAIVNISSLAGNYMGTPVTWYCGAKAGVLGITRSFATTYGRDGIRTNAVCPGAIDTPRVRDILDMMPGQEEIHNRRSPIGRMTLPEEIAACALFLASSESSCVNGQVIVADGGFSLAG